MTDHDTGEPGQRAFDRHESLVETVDDAVFVVDEAWELEYANASAVDVADATREELLGTAITTLTRQMLPREDAYRFERALADTFEAKGEPPETLVLEVDTATEWRFVEYVLSPMDRDGEVTSVAIVAREVTERRRTKQRLRRLTEEYETIFDNVEDPVFLIDVTGTGSGADFRVERLNPAYEATTGLRTEAVRGKTPRELLGDDAGEAVETNCRQCVETREPLTYEEELPMPDGRVRAETKLAPVIVDGEVTQIVGVSRDVSDRVAEKRQLQRREAQLTQLHEATRDLLDAETTQQVAAVASEAASTILDLEINGVHFYEADADALVPVAVSDASRELFGEVPAIDEGIAWEAFQQGESRRYDDVQCAETLYNPDTPIRSEMVLPLGDHGVFIVSAREADGFTDTDVEFARTLVANTEAALDRVTGEQQLRTRQQELEQQNDRLAEFASIVSHDLRNPLNVAQGRLELAQMDCDSEHLDTVTRAHDRIEALVDDLLTLARGGESVEDADDVDLAALARDCWTTVDTADASYVVETDRTVRADRGRLRQLIENLIRNAVEHGGTDVTVTVGDLDDGFYVADDGPGVPADKREQVFEEGFSTTTGGTGYGLAIVEQVVEAHGWEVRLTDGEDGGARFEVTGVERGQ